MGLQVFNVRTRRKEPFAPLSPEGPIGMYVCGLTVYDHVHIGHARTYVPFEVIRRWLEHCYPGRLRHVQNVTDVEDKILTRAKERGVSPRAHAKEWGERCAAQMVRLGIRPAHETPHVTTSVPDIIAFIQSIVKQGSAYATPEGNVYFDVPAYEATAQAAFKACGYGSLSNRDYREMEAGTRKDVEGDKRHPADFALWKSADAGDHLDANWESPWGRGRPGWHIECSLMATRALGDQIDIHGGGQDLIFPHHENEIAQSQAKTGKAPFVNVWMHTGFLNVDGEKMSKSLGNFITLESLLDELSRAGTDPAALRLYFLQTHYRSKIDFSRKGLAEAMRAHERLERTRQLLSEAAATPKIGCADIDGPLGDACAALERDVEAAMDDDFHTPGAIAALHAFQRWANAALDGQRPDKPLGSGAAAQALAAFERCGRFLTLFDKPLRAPGEATALLAVASKLGLRIEGDASESTLQRLIADARVEARSAKDWPRSDAIRDAVKAAGYLMEDTPTGVRWRKA
ncbi:MAG: cysteine--tRNA ligase [bacterium]